MIVSPEFKDKLLNELIISSPEMRYSGDIRSEAKKHDLNYRVLDSIFRQFNDRGFIEYETFLGGAFMIDITVNAHDYMLKGGHLGEFQFLENQVMKLERELENLRTQVPKENFDRIKGITDTILSAASAYNSFK